MILNEKEAFDAMSAFLELMYEQTKSDDIGALLGDMTILQDGSTADPAIWSDWIESIAKIKK